MKMQDNVQIVARLSRGLCRCGNPTPTVEQMKFGQLHCCKRVPTNATWFSLNNRCIPSNAVFKYRLGTISHVNQALNYIFNHICRTDMEFNWRNQLPMTYELHATFEKLYVLPYIHMTCYPFIYSIDLWNYISTVHICMLSIYLFYQQSLSYQTIFFGERMKNGPFINITWLMTTLKWCGRGTQRENGNK